MSKDVPLQKLNERALPYLFFSILTVQIMWPITYIGQSADGRNLPAMIMLYQLLSVAQMVLGILSMGQYPRARRWLIGLALLWLVSGVTAIVFPAERWPLLVGYLIVTLFQFSLAAILSIYIFKTTQITLGVLLAASAVYLLIGSVFVPVYDLIETVTFLQTNGQHAFQDNLTPVGTAFPWQTLIYYSISVLTTVGFGDVTPIAPWARAATMLESLMGVLYLTFVVARLVSLFSATDE